METQELISLIRTGEIETLSRIISFDSSIVKQKTEAGISLLQFAVYCRNKPVIDLFRAHATVSFFEAASLGELNEVQKNLSKDRTLLNAFAPDGFTALGLACFFGYDNVVEYLLNEGADPNIAASNSFKVAPIHSACAISNVKITERLIAHGANVSARQLDDVTPLHETAHNGALELTRLLLDHGADVHAKTGGGKTPIDMAVERGFTQVADLIRQYTDRK